MNHRQVSKAGEYTSGDGTREREGPITKRRVAREHTGVPAGNSDDDWLEMRFEGKYRTCVCVCEDVLSESDVSAK